jgi:hypothetical protein
LSFSQNRKNYDAFWKLTVQYRYFLPVAAVSIWGKVRCTAFASYADFCSAFTPPMPLSGLLFVLGQEPLASAIRSDEGIAGIKLLNVKKEVKNIAFADDATDCIS